jgi:hypothetical protein
MFIFILVLICIFIFAGERDEENLPHGVGRCVYTHTGLVYEGQFEHGSAHGLDIVNVHIYVLYICIYIYMYVCMYICMYIYTYGYTY